MVQKNVKNTTKSGVNDDVETLSVTSSEESVKVVGVEKPGQSRKRTVAKSLSDHAAKIVNKPSERKNMNVQQSRQVELMNNDSKENKGVIGIRGKAGIPELPGRHPYHCGQLAKSLKINSSHKHHQGW